MIKKHIFNALLLEDTLDQLSEKGVSVRGSTGPLAPEPPTETQDFDPRIIYDATRMQNVYILFYCLENAVRDLIAQRLLEQKGSDWWNLAIPKKIKEEVEKIRRKEAAHRYHAQRSNSAIGYTMFGHLSQIIVSNWEDFSDLFPNQAWITARFADLEMSRNIIMHTNLLPDIEIDRIQSIVRDWLAQVG